MTNNLNAVFIAGTWTENPARVKTSKIMQKLAGEILTSKLIFNSFEIFNGGNLNELNQIKQKLETKNVIFWLPEGKSVPEIDFVNLKYTHSNVIAVKSLYNKQHEYKDDHIRSYIYNFEIDILIEISENEYNKNCFDFRLFNSDGDIIYTGHSVSSLAVHIANCLKNHINTNPSKTNL